jgi:hypothetical protein
VAHHPAGGVAGGFCDQSPWHGFQRVFPVLLCTGQHLQSSAFRWSFRCDKDDWIVGIFKLFSFLDCFRMDSSWEKTCKLTA